MKTLLQKTENFYMQEQSKNMHIIDDELFFTIEEKTKGIELSDKGLDFLSKSSGDSTFFILPDINVELSNISDIKEKEEIIRNYAIKSERMHTMTQLLKAYSLFDKDAGSFSMGIVIIFLNIPLNCFINLSGSLFFVMAQIP